MKLTCEKGMRGGHKRGFTVLFSVLIASLLLAVGFGMFNIVYRELQLSGITRDSDVALFAADAGLECGLYWDFNGVDQVPEVQFSPDPAVDGMGSSETIQCGGASREAEVISIESFPNNPSHSTTTWRFILPTGGGSQSCAEVLIARDTTPFGTITSSGRNEGDANCIPPGGGRTVERTLESILY